MSASSYEAGNAIAAEFMYSIDNLHNEFRHVMQEIQHLDTRVQELQREMDRDRARYLKNSLSGSKLAHLPQKIERAQAEVVTLSDAKIALAQYAVTLLSRTDARLSHTRARVHEIQGEVFEPAPCIPPVNQGRASLEASARSLSDSSLRHESYNHIEVPDVVMPGTARQLSESVRTALSSGEPHDSQDSKSSNKKRRLAASSSSGRLATPNKRSASPAVAGSARGRRGGRHAAADASSPYASDSRDGRTQYTPDPQGRSQLAQVSQLAQEAEEDGPSGETAAADATDADDEDTRLYCFCQKRSYGEFHMGCVGLRTPPNKWYCTVCEKALAAANAGTVKRRKK
ncbi:hypothetical protein FISHEDRAFT_78405 [Fistulina hepatica ATCC 64428]|nr:hypothetical protein FISHEDRAFT_78405 [Fistulina hepatica ATCC 64428]